MDVNGSCPRQKVKSGRSHPVQKATLLEKHSDAEPKYTVMEPNSRGGQKSKQSEMEDSAYASSNNNNTREQPPGSLIDEIFM